MGRGFTFGGQDSGVCVQCSKIQARKPYIYLRKCWKIKVKNAAFLKVKCSLYSCLLTVWFPYKSTVLKLTFVNYVSSPENFDLQLSSESRLHNLPPYQGTATDRVGTRERGGEGRERVPLLIMQLAGYGCICKLSNLSKKLIQLASESRLHKPHDLLTANENSDTWHTLTVLFIAQGDQKRFHHQKLFNKHQLFHSFLEGYYR